MGSPVCARGGVGWGGVELHAEDTEGGGGGGGGGGWQAGRGGITHVADGRYEAHTPSPRPPHTPAAVPAARTPPHAPRRRSTPPTAPPQARAAPPPTRPRRPSQCPRACAPARGGRDGTAPARGSGAAARAPAPVRRRWPRIAPPAEARWSCRHPRRRRAPCRSQTRAARRLAPRRLPVRVHPPAQPRGGGRRTSPSPVARAKSRECGRPLMGWGASAAGTRCENTTLLRPHGVAPRGRGRPWDRPREPSDGGPSASSEPWRWWRRWWCGGSGGHTAPRRLYAAGRAIRERGAGPGTGRGARG